MARITLSTTLLVGAVTLVGAIVVGESMGNRVLGSIGRFASVNATPLPVPSPDPSTAAHNWKHETVIAVATDPGFPDPRVTPPPPPPPPPPPTARPIVRPSPTLAPVPTLEPEPTPEPAYTSPPLPVPLVTGTDVSPTPPIAATPEATPTPTPTPAPRRR